MSRVLEYQEEGDNDRDEGKDSGYDQTDMMEGDLGEQRILDDCPVGQQMRKYPRPRATVLVCSSAVVLQVTITQFLVWKRFSLQYFCSPLRSRDERVGVACACVGCVQRLLNAEGTKSRAHGFVCLAKHDPLSDSQS